MTEWVMRYWLELAFAVSLSGFGLLIKKYKAMEKGIQALLRDRIVQAYYHYEPTKSITLHGLENVEAMYKEYSNLGGNGAVKKLVEDMRKYKVVERREVKDED